MHNAAFIQNVVSLQKLDEIDEIMMLPWKSMLLLVIIHMISKEVSVLKKIDAKYRC